MADYFLVFRTVQKNKAMIEIKRNALLKELSRKLEDQNIHQSGGTFPTLPDTSGVIRSDARRQNHILIERARKMKDVLMPTTEQ